MPWRYSSVIHSEVWVDTSTEDEDMVCDECASVFDLEEEGDVSDDGTFCEVCFNKLFGGPLWL